MIFRREPYYSPLIGLGEEKDTDSIKRRRQFAAKCFQYFAKIYSQSDYPSGRKARKMNQAYNIYQYYLTK